ncbi:hypothetical protein GGX14DRAFT_404390 [Mycena pura]|uniref:Uncharacterized protein n=1 Tax=Mycena pura TaxID=153505 RepID=A0AAD6UTY9_9AGAR|nr:hypothetical protein GGX14DRAFT_404390 [Mycena pura]
MLPKSQLQRLLFATVAKRRTPNASGERSPGSPPHIEDMSPDSAPTLRHKVFCDWAEEIRVASREHPAPPVSRELSASHLLSNLAQPEGEAARSVRSMATVRKDVLSVVNLKQIGLKSSDSVRFFPLHIPSAKFDLHIGHGKTLSLRQSFDDGPDCDSSCTPIADLNTRDVSTASTSEFRGSRARSRKFMTDHSRAGSTSAVASSGGAVVAAEAPYKSVAISWFAFEVLSAALFKVTLRSTATLAADTAFLHFNF